MREKEIEKKLKEAVKKAGGWCVKWVSPGNSGVPDRICLFPGGRIVFVELKAPGKKPRVLQEKQIKKIRKLGFRVEVIDSEEGIQGLFEG
jgi:DsbC/DsbD-like thiol-disulfide interchange protein